MISARALEDLAGAGRDEVRRYVRDTLEGTPSYNKLAPAERAKIARNLVDVLSYLSDPAAGQAELAPVARAQAALQQPDAAEQLKGRLAQRPGSVGGEFSGGATTQAGEAFKTLASAVDFPRFVSSLIEGVFTSIVNSSIKQMHEFGRFLEAVVQSAREFAQDHVSEEEARDYLVDKFPKALSKDRSGGQSRLMLNDDLEDEDFPNFGDLLGMTEVPDIDDEEGEKQLVESAQLKLARMRQQQLSTMLLMGINRIIVTEGEIKATVLFDVSSSDEAERTAQAAMDDTQSHRDSTYEYKRSGNIWGTDRSGSGSSAVNTRVSTANASTLDTSESKLEAHAKLTGFVQVKFKSETFPLERLASQTEFSAIQERASR